MSELRLLQAALLDIALEVKRICETNQIPFSLCGGSMLGAVRHNGFIPWDDDMDLAMLRTDYERFLTICTTELGKEYWLQTNRTDKNYANSFAKIGIRTSSLQNPNIENPNTFQMISIDIFPLDVFPNQSYLRKYQAFCEKNFVTAAYSKAMYDLDNPISLFGKLRRKVILKYASFKTLSYILMKQEKLEKKFNQSGCNEVGIVLFQESYLSKEIFLNQIYIEFEQYKFPIPEKYDDILTGIYGDYQELPPLEQRITHNFYNLRLGNYQIENILHEELFNAKQ